MKSTRQLAEEIVGFCRARTVSGEVIHSTSECVSEVLGMFARYTLVPKVPTPEMIEAHQSACAGDAGEAGPDRIKECWSEMLEAAHGL